MKSIADQLRDEVCRLLKERHIIRERLGCPPDCDLLTWVRMMGDFWSQNGGQEPPLLAETVADVEPQVIGDVPEVDRVLLADADIFPWLRPSQSETPHVSCKRPKREEPNG
jgi:hypothetical protein